MTLSRLERGITKSPSRRTIELLEDDLETPIGELLLPISHDGAIAYLEVFNDIGDPNDFEAE